MKSFKVLLSGRSPSRLLTIAACGGSIVVPASEWADGIGEFNRRLSAVRRDL